MATGEATVEFPSACCRLLDLLDTPQDILPRSGFRIVVFPNADQLSLRDLDLAQFAGAKFSEEVTVGHRLGRFDWKQLQNEVERQQEQPDVDDCQYPPMSLLAFHLPVSVHAVDYIGPREMVPWMRRNLSERTSPREEDSHAQLMSHSSGFGDGGRAPIRSRKMFHRRRCQFI
jgi:hypothetical protein